MDRSADALIGRVLDGRYRVGPKIARGGMATVYEATDLRLDRTVAVKVMHEGLADDEEFVRRFQREARSAARLAHHNVVAVFDTGDDHGTLFLVMEYVPGLTLRDLIRKEAPMSPAKALAMIEPVLSALAAAHDAGILHRDVKPENVLLADDGRVKVADFGLARAINSETQHTATGGVLIGTVSYLSPELVVNGKADARADVYAAGVLIYEMLTGHKPHQADSPIQVAYKHVHEDIPAPSASTPGIPPYVDALVARATARDTALRPADARVLLHQVRRVRHALDHGVVNDPDLVADLTPTTPIGGGRTPDRRAAGADHRAAGAGRRLAGRRLDDQRRGLRPGARRPRRAPADQPHPRRRARRPPPRPPALPPRPGAAGRRAAARAAGRPRRAGTSASPATPPPPASSTSAEAAAQVKLDKAGLSTSRSRTRPTPRPCARASSSRPTPTPATACSRTAPSARSSRSARSGTRCPTSATRRLDDAQQALDDVQAGLRRRGRALRREDRQGTGDHHRPGARHLAAPQHRRRRRGQQGPAADQDPRLHRQGRRRRPTNALEKRGFEVDTTEVNSDTVPKGRVVSQSPDSGTGQRGDVISLVVSKGPVMVEVPDVVRMGVAEARDRLEAAGFRVVVRESSLYIGVQYVVSTDPGGGTMAPKGSTVIVSVV